MAYILGHKEFFGLDFLVNKHTLIPRPDTEALVDVTINEIFDLKSSILNQNILLIDIGTGTGCIPITILQKLQKLKNYKIDAIATDISKQALKIAEKNTKKHKVAIKFLYGDLLSPVLQAYKLTDLQALVITANLPYLKEEWWQNEPSIQKEPKTALVSDNYTGLNIYERLLFQIVNLKSETLPAGRQVKNLKLAIFLEIDPRQSTQIFSLIQKYLSEASIEIVKDLSGFERVVKIKIF